VTQRIGRTPSQPIRRLAGSQVISCGLRWRSSRRFSLHCSLRLRASTRRRRSPTTRRCHRRRRRTGSPIRRLIPLLPVRRPRPRRSRAFRPHVPSSRARVRRPRFSPFRRRRPAWPRGCRVGDRGRPRSRTDAMHCSERRMFGDRSRLLSKRSSRPPAPISALARRRRRSGGSRSRTRT